MGRRLGHDVLIAHSKEDRLVARQLAGALSQRGLKVFLDEDALEPGMPLEDAMRSAIEDSRVVLILLSDAAVSSSWVLREMAIALALAGKDKRISVVPVLIPGWSGKSVMPFGLQERIWLELRGPNDLASAALRLDAFVRNLPADALQTFDWLDSLIKGIRNTARNWLAQSRTVTRSRGITRLESLSPYQVASGVNHELMFFGRNEELTLLVGRQTRTNYLLVGARQMGKTSLLKRIASKYEASRLMTLKDGNLDDALLQGGLPPLNAFTRENTAPGMLILLDEADLLVRADRERNYAILHQLRSISADTGCRFVLAGFWELHRSARMEHHSPIKNFAEVLELGPLDEVSSRRLATEPLATIGVTYASNALVDELLTLTGRRPNLIAIICHTFLKLLDPEKPVVTKAVLRAATDTREESGQPLAHAFADLGSLSEDEERCNVDRMVLFSTFRKKAFSVEELRRWLERAGASIPMSELQESLQRLRLAYVLLQKANRFDYAVPIIRDYLRHQTDDADNLVKMIAHDWNEQTQKK